MIIFLLCVSLIILKNVKEFNCFDVTPVKTPYDYSIHLKKNKVSSIFQIQFAKITGSVMFLMNCTRPDIAYAFSWFSSYIHSLSKAHCDALFQLLKYLRGIVGWCLHFSMFLIMLEGSCDANWVSNND